MKSKLFLTVLLLAAITTIGISQEKQRIKPPKDFMPDFIPEPVKPAETHVDLKAMLERVRVDSLVGLKGIMLLIEPINLKEDAKSAGLTKEQLERDVALKLRIAGIKVYSSREWVSLEENPLLVVCIATVSNDDLPVIVYSISIGFNQRVKLLRSPFETVNGETWDTWAMGICPKKEFQEVARKSVKDLADQFINDYLIANPKK